MELALLLAFSALQERVQNEKPVAQVARVVVQGKISTRYDSPADKLVSAVFDLKITCPLPKSPSTDRSFLIDQRGGVYGSVKPPPLLLFLGDLELDDDARRELAKKACGKVARIEGELMMVSSLGGSGSDFGPWMTIRVTKFTILD